MYIDNKEHEKIGNVLGSYTLLIVFREAIKDYKNFTKLYRQYIYIYIYTNAVMSNVTTQTTNQHISDHLGQLITVGMELLPINSEQNCRMLIISF